VKDYYIVLGISREAHAREIKRAYKELVKKWHPDLHPDDPAGRMKIQEINGAYGVLGNPARRQTYDRDVQEGRVVAGAWESPPDSAFHSYFLKMNEVFRRKLQKP
jgi:curved DNA-binding protein CbpA